MGSLKRSASTLENINNKLNPSTPNRCFVDFNYLVVVFLLIIIQVLDTFLPKINLVKQISVNKVTKLHINKFEVGTE